MAIKPPPISDVFRQLNDLLGDSGLKGEVDKSVRGLVQSALARLDVVLGAERLTGYYTWQQLVPLFLVVMMTWLVFWIPIESIAPRVGLAATSMLTLIAYRFAMSSVLPPIAYLTRLDVFMIGASVLVFGALAFAVAVAWAAESRGEALAERINFHARWSLPLLLILVAAAAFLG